MNSRHTLPTQASLVCCADLGTTRIKAALVGPEGRIERLVSAAAPASSQEQGHEFDADEHFDVLVELLRELARERPEGLGALCLTNQRASLVPVAEDSRAAGPALSWQDTRCDTIATRFYESFGPRSFTEQTGLPPSSLWTLSKLLWLRAERPEIFARTRKIALLPDYLLARLGVGEILTDPTNASVTGLLHIHGAPSEGSEFRPLWSRELLQAAQIGESLLPRIVPTARPVGALSPEIASRTGLSLGLPLVMGAGDQQCSSLGIGVLEPGSAGLCLGTAAVLSCPIESWSPPGVGAGFFRTVHVLPERHVLEGIQNAFGGAATFGARLLTGGDILAFEALARQAGPGAQGVVFIPHLAGIGSPDFLASARGAFFGLEHHHEPRHLARAILEGIALEMRRMLDSAACCAPVSRLVVSGGVSASSFMSSLLAGLTERELFLSPSTESSLLGAALLAWTALGRFTELRAAVSRCVGSQLEKLEPEIPPSLASSLYVRYLRCAESSLGSINPG